MFYALLNSQQCLVGGLQEFSLSFDADSGAGLCRTDLAYSHAPARSVVDCLIECTTLYSLDVRFCDSCQFTQTDNGDGGICDIFNKSSTELYPKRNCFHYTKVGFIILNCEVYNLTTNRRRSSMLKDSGCDYDLS